MDIPAKILSLRTAMSSIRCRCGASAILAKCHDLLTRPILTTRSRIPVITNVDCAGLIADPQRRPVDAVDVAQILVAGDDDVTFTDLHQRRQIQAPQPRCRNPHHATVAGYHTTNPQTAQSTFFRISYSRRFWLIFHCFYASAAY